MTDFGVNEHLTDANGEWYCRSSSVCGRSHRRRHHKNNGSQLEESGTLSMSRLLSFRYRIGSALNGEIGLDRPEIRLALVIYYGWAIEITHSYEFNSTRVLPGNMLTITSVRNIALLMCVHVHYFQTSSSDFAPPAPPLPLPRPPGAHDLSGSNVRSVSSFHIANAATHIFQSYFYHGQCNRII